MKKLFNKLIFLFLCPLMFYAQDSPKLLLISPNTEMSLTVGKREGLLWINNDVEDINIEFSLDAKQWTKIYRRINADLEYIGWEVPKVLAGTKIKIRIVDSENGEIIALTGEISVNTRADLQPLSKTTAEQSKILKILPLGNSITFDKRSRATDTRDVSERFGYRLPLFKLLKNRGINFNFIGSEHAGSDSLLNGNDSNAGFPGIKDNELHNLLATGKLQMPFYKVDTAITPGPYLESYTPDIILLHIGTNGNSDTGGTDPSDVENILDEIDRFEDSTGTEIKVVLAKIIDRVPNESFVTDFNINISGMANDRVDNVLNDAYPDQISKVDMQNGAGLEYIIDTMGTVGNGLVGDMNDALHPNDKGFLKMANVWFNSILSILPKLSVKLYLEGAYDSFGNMNQQLFLPLEQPFNSIIWNYNGTEQVDSIPSNVVDWVLVSLRSDYYEDSVAAKRAGFLLNDGNIVDMDGISPLVFTIDSGDYYVVVEHRNHLPVMSTSKVNVSP